VEEFYSLTLFSPKFMRSSPTSE